MIDCEITPEGRQVMASITAGRKKKKRKKRRPRNEMPKFRDPNTSGMFEGGVAPSGKGVHQNRERDVQRGSSRKEKHKGREDKYAKKVFQGRKLSFQQSRVMPLIPKVLIMSMQRNSLLREKRRERPQKHGLIEKWIKKTGIWRDSSTHEKIP